MTLHFIWFGNIDMQMREHTISISKLLGTLLVFKSLRNNEQSTNLF